MARRQISTIATADLETPRCKELRLARISDTNAAADLEKKIREVWEMRTDNDIPSHLPELGSQPLHNPSIVNGYGGVDHGTKYVLFEATAGIYGLYVFGSAVQGRSEEDLDNIFTEIFTRIVEELNPRVIVTPEVERLVRTLDHAGRIWRAISRHCEHILAGDAQIDLKRSDAEQQFVIQVLRSTFDTQTIRRRLLNGRIDKHKTGRTFMPATTIPLGYTKTANASVRINTADQPVIEAIMTGLAQGDPNEAIVAAASRLGGTSQRLKAAHGPGATFADHSNPAELVSTWKSWLELWTTGKYSLLWKSPYPDRRSVGGLRVVGSGPGRNGFIVFDMNWGLPPSGWAPAHIVSACQALARSRSTPPSRQGGSTHKTRKPLAGMAWSDDQHEYQLFAHQRGVYRVQRRKPGSGGPNGGWGRRPNLTGELVTHIPAHLLHKSVAEGIATAIEEGIEGQHLTGLDALELRGPSKRNISPLVAAEAERSMLENKRRNLLDAIAEADTTETRQPILAAADDLSRSISNIEKQIADLTKPAERQDAIEADSAIAARTLARLAQIRDGADADIGQALEVLLPEFHLKASDTSVEWSTKVLIPTAGGTLILGPVSGTVQAGMPRRVASTASRARDITEEFMTTGVSIEALVSSHGMRSRELYERAIHTTLAEAGLARNVRLLVVNSHLPGSVRKVLWQHIAGRRSTEYDQQWVRSVLRTYVQGTIATGPSTLTQVSVTRRAVAAELLRSGGEMSVAALAANTGFSEARIRAMSRYQRRKGRAAQPNTLVPAAARADTHVSLIPCPHCPDEWAAWPVMLPEVHAGVICRSCRRMPVDDSPVHPHDYLS